MQDEVRQFFDDFVESFPSFSGDRIASRYVAPYMAIQADGSARVFATAEAISAYFQGVLDDYRRQGCVSCRYADSQFQSLGGNSILATVTWLLLDAQGEVMASWRESYNLVRVGAQLKVRASVDHAA